MSDDPLSAYAGLNRLLRDKIEQLLLRAVTALQAGDSFPGTIHLANDIMKLVEEDKPIDDDENPELTDEDFARGRPFKEVFPEQYAAWEANGRQPIKAKPSP